MAVAGGCLRGLLEFQPTGVCIAGTEQQTHGRTGRTPATKHRNTARWGSGALLVPPVTDALFFCSKPRMRVVPAALGERKIMKTYHRFSTLVFLGASLFSRNALADALEQDSSVQSVQS